MANNYEKAIVLMVRTSLTQREIAKELDVTEETISRWKKRKDFEDLKTAEEKKFLEDLSSKSIRTMEELLTAKSELVRFNAAKDILDRTGHKPVEVSEMSVTDVPTFIDDIGSEDDG